MPLVAKPNPEGSKFRRVFAGIVSVGMLASLARDVLAGVTDNNGEAFRRVDHPILFCMWAGFVAIIGFGMLLYAVVGDQRRQP